MNKNFMGKKFLAFTLALALMIPFTPGMSFAEDTLSQQVITNGDFENGTPGLLNTGAGSASSWTFGSGGAAARPQMQIADNTGAGGFLLLPGALGAANTGQRVLYAANAAAGNGSWSFVTSNRFNVHPGDNVTLSGAYSFTAFDAAGTANLAEIKLEFYDASDNQLSIAYIPAGSTPDVRIRWAGLPNTVVSGQARVATGGPQTFRFSAQAPPSAAYALAVLVMVKDAAVANGEIYFDSMLTGANGFRITASRPQVEQGQPFIISGEMQNANGLPLEDGVEVVGELPSGFNLPNNSVRVNGQPVLVQDGSIVFSLGSLPPGARANFALPIVTTQGTKVGRSYEFQFYVRNASNKQRIVESNRIKVRIVADPFFDLGTIVGKVFDDKNENGWQDKGEEGIPMVHLATEQGMEIITDQDGKYHIPGVTPGRHIVKIDDLTLPEGVKYITEQAAYVKVTPGLLAKASFAVKMPESSRLPEELKKAVKFRIVPEDNTANPELNVEMENPIVYIAHGQTKSPIRFFMSSNYNAIIHHWKLEVRNAIGQVVWQGIGEGAPPGEVLWDGRDNNGNLLPGDETFSYRLMVSDKNYREDWTDLNIFKTVSMKVGEENFPGLSLPTSGYFKMARFGKKDISHKSYHSVKVVGKVLEDPEIVDLHINDESVAVAEDGTFIHDSYLPSGQSEVMISTTNREGDILTYGDDVNLKATSFFLVGLIEGSLGFNDFQGNRDIVGRDDDYASFDPDGRVALYGRMRWKDWLRVTTSYDSDGKSGNGASGSNTLFTNLNPYQYYQTYGDDSTILYDAFNSQSDFYIMAEADKSFLRWGNFNTGFDDFELSQFNRTLSGLKVHYESPKTTVYGEPMADLTGFQASAQQLADHNEFLGTGGSLYYLRHVNVTEGSEKVKVQIRDRTTNMILQEKDLFEGSDYEIIYPEGRVTLSKPLSSTVEDDSIVHNLILPGNDVYLIVDYEYEPAAGSFVDGLKGTTRGIKGHLAFGDTINVRMGGLYVEDKTFESENGAKIRGLSMDVKAFHNTRVRMEFAEQNGLLTNNEYSYDGGFNQVNLSLVKPDNQRDRAFSVKAESKPLKNLDLSGYYQYVDPFFSNSEVISSRGTRKYGIEAQYLILPQWAVRMRYDSVSKLQAKQPDVTPTDVTSPFFLDADRIDTFMLQSTYTRGKLSVIGEYKYQDIKQQTDRNMNIFTQLEDGRKNMENGVAVQATYKFSEKFTPYVRGQVGVGSGDNNQLTVGIRSQVTDQMSGFAEQTISNIGDGTRIGFESRVSDDTTTYSTFSFENDKSLQDKIFRSSVGTTTDISDRHRVYSERQLTGYRSYQNFSDVFGYRADWSDKLFSDFRFERAYVKGSESLIDRNAGSLTVGYTLSDKLRNNNKIEARYDKGDQKIFQWLYKGDLVWKINKDWTHKTKAEISGSWDRGTKGTLGRYVELGTGFAYRPIENDRLAMLFNYTYLQIMPLSGQFTDSYGQDPYYDYGLPFKENSHKVSAELVYDINKWVSLVEKGALKRYWVDSTGTDPVAVFDALWINRLNFHVTRKWDIAVEYRLRWQREAAGNMKQGVLVEVDRELFGYVRAGVGYNFTDFSDSLDSRTNYSNNGFFARMSGKF